MSPETTGRQPSSTTVSEPHQPAVAWHSELDRSHWRVLNASFLGWIFDGYESYVLLLVMAPALRQLLGPDQLPQLARYAGMLVAMTLLGWAIGGVLAGILADYVGRKRLMMFTILTYALFTGLTGFSQSWLQMCVFRFITGLGLGGEWATGATLLAETWPARARAKGLGIMQSAYGWGSLLAAGLWYFLSSTGGPDAWRFVFIVGAVPALFVFYIRRNVHESAGWLQTRAERRQLQSQRRSGARLSSEEALVANFTVTAIFSNPVLRRRVLWCLAMALGSIIGFWAVSTWIPAYVESVAREAGRPNPPHWSALAGIAYTVGGIIGYLSAGFIADGVGRRALLAWFFVGSLVMTPALYLWTHTPEAMVIVSGLSGIFTMGQAAWMAIYPPELFPTAVRATAVSLIFNAARFIAFLGPVYAGVLIARFGGYTATALLFGLVAYGLALCAVPFVPETKGKPLPA